MAAAYGCWRHHIVPTDSCRHRPRHTIATTVTHRAHTTRSPPPQTHKFPRARRFAAPLRGAGGQRRAAAGTRYSTALPIRVQANFRDSDDLQSRSGWISPQQIRWHRHFAPHLVCQSRFSFPRTPSDGNTVEIAAGKPGPMLASNAVLFHLHSRAPCAARSVCSAALIVAHHQIAWS